MTCERVVELAAGFLDGSLGAEARAAVAGHLAECEECRGLLASLGEAPPEDPELTAAIVRRTAGSACASARDRLCDWIDETLDPVEAGWVDGHLERCAECAALAHVLSSMRAELPRLAEVDPDPGFVAAVLARTSLAPRLTPLAERWMTAMRRLLDRPRIALEGAFVAAMIVVLPIGALQGRGEAAPADALGAIRHASGAASANLNILARDAWATTRGFVAEHAAGIAASLERDASQGTFSTADASGTTSEGAGGLERKAGAAQEKRR